MVITKIHILILSFFSIFISGTLCKFNYSEYAVLPPLFHLDYYDNCMQALHDDSPNVYCFVYAEVAPDNSSDLWQRIVNYSSDTRHHYRHDRMFIGVCLEKCKKLVQSWEKDKQQDLYVGETTNEELLELYERIYQRSQYKEYEELIGLCLNDNFQKEYNLKLRTSIQYCREKEKPLRPDYLLIVFLCVVGIIIALNILSTSYDFWLKKCQAPEKQNDSFYKDECEAQVDQLLTSFSVVRNYYNLKKQPKFASDLSFFNGLRIISSLFVMLGHVFLIGTAMPLINVDFWEHIYETLFYKTVANLTVVVQTFFAMSGFLMYCSVYKFNSIKPTSSFGSCVKVFLKMLSSRYLRLMPSIVLLMLFTAGVFIHLQDGPLWTNFYLMSDIFHCRNDWWKNLFCINNLYGNTSCQLHTWYLAADMQLYIVFLAMIIFIFRFPQYRKTIYTLVGISTFVIPFFVTLIKNLPATLVLAPETFRYSLFTVEVFQKGYIPFYMNLGSYFFGILGADFYIKQKVQGKIKNLEGELKYEILWWCCLSGTVLLLLCGGLFLLSPLVNSSFFNAVYAASFRNIWGILNVGLFLCSIYNSGWIGLQIFKLPVFNTLAKLSYQTYLWHVVATILTVGANRTLLYESFLTVNNSFYTVFLFAHVIAFIVWILFESPLNNIITIIYDSKPKKPQKSPTVKANGKQEQDRKEDLGNSETHLGTKLKKS